MWDPRKTLSNMTYRSSPGPVWMVLLISITPWEYSVEKKIFKDMLTAALSPKDWWTEQEKVPAGEDLGASCRIIPAVWNRWLHKDISALFLSARLKTGTISTRAIALTTQILYFNWDSFLARVLNWLELGCVEGSNFLVTESNPWESPQPKIIRNRIKSSISKLALSVASRYVCKEKYILYLVRFYILCWTASPLIFCICENVEQFSFPSVRLPYQGGSARYVRIPQVPNNQDRN